MGCFLGCFGDASDRRSRKLRIHRASSQQKGVKKFQQQSLLLVERSISENPTSNSVSEFKHKGGKQLSSNPRKRVAFNLNTTTYEYYSLYESTESVAEGNQSFQKQKEKDISSSSQPLLDDDNSVESYPISFPPNHRYHNARDSDDETEDYSDSELDVSKDESEDEDDIHCTMNDEEKRWSESIFIPSVESRIENQSTSVIERPLLQEDEMFGSKTQAKSRSDYVSSVLNPIENIIQWKTVTKGTFLLKSQKEINQPLFCHSVRSDQIKTSNQEISLDASLSNWLVSAESMLQKKTIPDGESISLRGRPCSKGLGAL